MVLVLKKQKGKVPDDWIYFQKKKLNEEDYKYLIIGFRL